MKRAYWAIPLATLILIGSLNPARAGAEIIDENPLDPRTELINECREMRAECFEKSDDYARVPKLISRIGCVIQDLGCTLEAYGKTA